MYVMVRGDTYHGDRMNEYDGKWGHLPWRMMVRVTRTMATVFFDKKIIFIVYQ